MNFYNDYKSELLFRVSRNIYHFQSTQIRISIIRQSLVIYIKNILNDLTAPRADPGFIELLHFRVKPSIRISPNADVGLKLIHAI